MVVAIDINPHDGRAFQLSRPDEKLAAMNASWDLGAAVTGAVQDELIRQIETALQVAPLDARSGLMMNWDEVRALKNTGHSIGAHTLSHPNLAHVTPQEGRSEITGSKQKLEAEMQQPVVHFSYPHPALNPQWSQQTLQVTREAGFQSAVLTTMGSACPGDDPLALRRVPADEDTSLWIWQLERAFLRD